MHALQPHPPRPTCFALLSLQSARDDRSPPQFVLLTFAVAAHAEYVKEAVQEDQAGNYQKAFDLYKIALEYFSTHLKYEKNPRSKAAISEKARPGVLPPDCRRRSTAATAHRGCVPSRSVALLRSSRSTWRGRSTSNPSSTGR